jgi:hypothetical protein
MQFSQNIVKKSRNFTTGTFNPLAIPVSSFLSTDTDSLGNRWFVDSQGIAVKIESIPVPTNLSYTPSPTN